MLIHIIRAIVLVGCPVIGYLQVSSNWKGVLLGLAAALIVLAIEFVIDHIPLDALISAVSVSTVLWRSGLLIGTPPCRA